MGPELTSLPRTTACPSCGGALRPEATWCSLCFHDFRAAADPVAPEPVVVVQTPSYGVVDPLTGPLLDLALPLSAPVAPPVAAPVVVAAAPAAPAPVSADPTWPCTRCEAHNPLAATTCHLCGTPFLAQAKDRPSLVVPGVGDLYSMSRGRRAGLATAAVAAVLMPLALITLLLTDTPKQSPKSTPNGTTTVVTTTP